MVRLFFQQGFSRALAGLIVYIYPILFGESGLGEYSVYSSYVMVAVIMGFGPMEALAGRASSNNISERDCLLFYALLIVLLLSILHYPKFPLGRHHWYILFVGHMIIC